MSEQKARNIRVKLSRAVDDEMDVVRHDVSHGFEPRSVARAAAVALVVEREDGEPCVRELLGQEAVAGPRDVLAEPVRHKDQTARAGCG